jgi:hypothetical protein
MMSQFSNVSVAQEQRRSSRNRYMCHVDRFYNWDVYACDYDVLQPILEDSSDLIAVFALRSRFEKRENLSILASAAAAAQYRCVLASQNKSA